MCESLSNFEVAHILEDEDEDGPTHSIIWADELFTYTANVTDEISCEILLTRCRDFHGRNIINFRFNLLIINKHIT